MEDKRDFTPLSPSDLKVLVKFYESHYSRSYQIASKITRNRQIAEDVAQESFVKAYRHIEQFVSCEHFVRWLTITTVNTSIDILRKNKHYLYLEDFKPLCYNLKTDQFLPEQSVLQAEEVKAMLEKVYSLSPIHSNIIYLKYYSDMSYKEISEFTGVKENTLRSRCHRALKLLHSKCRD